MKKIANRMVAESILGQINDLKKTMRLREMAVSASEPLEDIKFIVPTFKISDQWGKPGTESRKMIEKFMQRIEGEDFNSRIKAVDDLFRGCQEVVNGIECDSPPDGVEDIGEILSRLVFLESMASIVYDFEASAGGFLLESFLAALFGGESRQVPTGSPNVIDFIADHQGQEVGYSLKLLKDEDSKVEGSEFNLERDMARYRSPVMYIVGLKRQTKGEDAVFQIDFYIFPVGIGNEQSKQAFLDKLRGRDPEKGREKLQFVQSSRNKLKKKEQQRLEKETFKKLIDNDEQTMKELLGIADDFISTVGENGEEVVNPKGEDWRPHRLKQHHYKIPPWTKNRNANDLTRWEIKRNPEDNLKLALFYKKDDGTQEVAATQEQIHNKAGNYITMKAQGHLEDPKVEAYIESELERELSGATARPGLYGIRPAFAVGRDVEVNEADGFDYQLVAQGKLNINMIRAKFPKPHQVLKLGSKREVQELANEQARILSEVYKSQIVKIYNNLAYFSNAINDYFLDPDRGSASQSGIRAMQRFNDLKAAVTAEIGDEPDATGLKEQKLKPMKISEKDVKQIIMEEMRGYLYEQFDACDTPFKIGDMFVAVDLLAVLESEEARQAEEEKLSKSPLRRFVKRAKQLAPAMAKLGLGISGVALAGATGGAAAAVVGAATAMSNKDMAVESGRILGKLFAVASQKENEASGPFRDFLEKFCVDPETLDLIEDQYQKQYIEESNIVQALQKFFNDNKDKPNTPLPDITNHLVDWLNTNSPYAASDDTKIIATQS